MQINANKTEVVGISKLNGEIGTGMDEDKTEWV